MKTTYRWDWRTLTLWRHTAFARVSPDTFTSKTERVFSLTWHRPSVSTGTS